MPSPDPNDHTLSASRVVRDETAPLDQTSEGPRPAAAPVSYPFLAAAQQPDEVGRLGRYRVLAALGHGGMGVVFRAEDPVLKRNVALKVMLPHVAANPSAKARFVREARAQAAVEHDHIIPIFDIYEDHDPPFLAMPLLRGMTLAAALKANPRPPLTAVVRIGREIAEGLAAAHGTGLVHRDIKPANVWLEGNRLRVRILDFGLARAAAETDPAATGEEPLTAEGAVVGTPMYMSPEQARGEPLDPRTDLFSLGVVLYQMATGRLPFEGKSTAAVLLAVVSHHPTGLAQVAPPLPPALNALITRLLAKDAAGRPATAADVAAELQQIEFGLTAAAGVQVVPLDSVPGAPAAANPWEDIDATEPVTAASESRAVEPVPHTRKPGGSKFALAAGVLGLLLVVGLAGVMYKAMTRSDTSVAKEEEPPAPPKPKPPVAVPRPNDKPVLVELLPLVDPAADAVRGTWERAGPDLTSKADGTGNPVLEFPYQPPDEYDLAVEFTRTEGTAGINLALSRGGRAFECCLAVGGDRYSVPVAGGGLIFNDPTAVRPALRLTNGRRYVARAEVRKDRVAVFLDGTPAAELRTDYTNLSAPGATGVRDPRHLGLATSPSVRVAFHRVAVTEVSGRGRVGRTAGAANDPDRTAAERKALEWVLSVGGELVLVVNGQAVRLGSKQGEKLPAGPFAVRGLGFTGLKGLDAAALENLRAVPRVHHELGFQDTALGEAELAKLGTIPGLADVRALSLYGTGVPDAGLAHLKSFPQLNWLHLAHTPVTGAGLAHLRGLKKLEWLNLFGCPVDDDALAQLADMTSLVHLDLARTRVGGGGLKHLTRLTNLRSLNTGNATDAGVEPLLALRGLTDLILGGTQVTGAALKTFRVLPDLATLGLYGTGVADADLTALEEFPALRTLHLVDHGDRITDAGLEHLAACPGLTSVDLSKTKVTEPGVKKLAAALPACKIVWDGGTIEPKEPPKK